MFDHSRNDLILCIPSPKINMGLASKKRYKNSTRDLYPDEIQKPKRPDLPDGPGEDQHVQK